MHKTLILNKQVKEVQDSNNYLELNFTIFPYRLSHFWKQMWPARMLCSLCQVPSESSSCALPVTAKSVNDFSAKQWNWNFSSVKVIKNIAFRGDTITGHYLIFT